jgi:4-hydroxybenzoate polyprenyltransferase
MDAEPPQRADRHGGDRLKARRAFAIAGAGVITGLATAIVSAFGDIGVRQAIMLGVPAALLTFGGLIAAVASDSETAERQGFRAGLKAGSLLRRGRAVFGRRGKGAP